MKKSFTIMVALMLSLVTFAQKSASVKGRIMDKTGKPVEAVTISLLQAKDSLMAKAAVSNKNGAYELEKIKEGKYFVTITSVAHQNFSSPAFELADGQEYEVATATLTPAEKKLKDVVVTSQKPMIEVRADRTVFNVENSINATGSTAMELLQKSPGVLVIRMITLV